MTNFLNTYKTSSTELTTHTRIGNKEFNIYGGKYYVKDNDNFLQEYFNEIVKNGNKEYLTEKQLDNGVIAIDFDFRYNYEVELRQHDKDMITNFIIQVTEPLKKFYNFTNENEFDIFVMEKPNVNRVEDKSITKDGIHIIIGLNMEKNIKKDYRNIILNDFQNSKEFDKLPLTNTWDNVIDKGVLEATTNWNLYGSRKPDNEAYELKYHYIMGFDENDQEFMMDEQEIKPIDFELLKKLSVRNNDRPNIETKVFKSNNKEKKTNKNIIIEDDDTTDIENYDEINVKEGLDEVKKCLECVKVFCESGYEPDWSKIGQILKNEYKNEGERYFVDWTFEYGSENKKKECSNHYKNNLKYTPKTDKNRISIKTLHFLAKQKNSKLYLKYFPPLKLDDTFQYIDEILENITDYSLANYWVKYFGNKYKCIDTVKNIFYEFNENNLWNRNEGGTPIRLSITQDLKKDFKNYQDYLKKEFDKNISNEQKELINKKLVTVKDILTKIEKTNDKRNILSEIKDLIFDEEFEKDMNKELYVLPLKNNKMINMKTLELTERSINNKFNYMCDVEYVEMTKEQEDDIKKYYMSLFCDREDTMMVVLNILKSIFVGLPLKYIFFFTGSGNNGKSLLFEFLKAIFNKAIDTISKEVILDTKSNNSITTQFEKLDKVRVGYVTETKEEDILNDIVIKAITGGDAMDCRKLFKTNETITPTCNLCVLTNKLPKFNVEPAILQRIIICPMNNTFEVDNTFKTKMLEKRNLLFSFIMKYGKVLDKFELTDEMINSKNEYKDDNISDCLGDFIKEKCDIVEFVKSERIESKNFILEYKNWLLLNRLKDKNMDKKATYYTKTLKKIFKIESQESNSKTYYKGIIWKSDEEDEEIKDTEK